MTDKKPKSFTLDKANVELCDDLDNASAVVNDLLTQYRKGADKDTVAIDLQIEQKQRELKEAKRTVERLEEDIQELQQVKAGIAKQDDAQLGEAKKALEGVPRKATNPGIENWAGKLGMTPTELIRELD